MKNVFFAISFVMFIASCGNVTTTEAEVPMVDTQTVEIDTVIADTVITDTVI